MIYVRFDDPKRVFIVLEPTELCAMKSGLAVSTPDKSIAVLYVPDRLKLQERLDAVNKTRPFTMDDFVREHTACADDAEKFDEIRQ